MSIETTICPRCESSCVAHLPESIGFNQWICNRCSHQWDFASPEERACVPKHLTGELRVELPKARKLRMRCYTVEEVKRILVNAKQPDQLFFWLAAETGARVGELIALRASDVDVKNLCIEISKAIWGGEEDEPKTEAGNRVICISSRLGAALMEFLAGRTEGICFRPQRVLRGTLAMCLCER